MIRDKYKRPDFLEPADRQRAAADHLGHDRLDRRRGPADASRRRSATRWSSSPRPRPDIVGLTADLAKYTDLHIFAKAYPDRFYQMGMAEQLADGRRRRHGARRLHALRHHLRRVRHAARLRLHLHGDRRGNAAGEDRLRAAGPHDGLRPEPSGDRGPRDLPRHAEPDHHRSLRRARHRAGDPRHRRHHGPVYMRLLRGNVPLVLDATTTASRSARPSCCATAPIALVISSGLMTMRALEAAEMLAARGRRRRSAAHARRSSRSTRRRSCRGRPQPAGRSWSPRTTPSSAASARPCRPADACRRHIRFRQMALPDAFLDAGALPTLHDRYGISTAAMVKSIKNWL